MISMPSSASIPSNSLTFIGLTQHRQWEWLVKAHGGNENTARNRFVQRLVQQIDERGTLDVLRHGIRDQNVEIRLSYPQACIRRGA